jgi:uncharacterized FlaG/YvyC family protein
MDVSAIAAVSAKPAPAPSEDVAPSAGLSQSEPQSTASARSNGIAAAIAKIFGTSSDPQQVHLSVSYRVVKGDPDEIVTVFTDSKTGREITQVPSEALIGLAQFFDQENGVTLDKSA